MSSRDALWESGHDETVEVNQRALIDKVLARYSGEFTVFRELLQNSDDARSEEVEIVFETKPSVEDAPAGDMPSKQLPDLKSVLVQRWKFRNNGIVFRDEDWSRLKKIAEGNPDEEKIGAFGVGFYSLFSVTDDPWVTSGEQWMAFYWKDKKDQLYARRGTLPSNAEGKEWTTFDMPLREPAPIPLPFDLIRFLTSSITFMTHLKRVSVFLDDKRLARLEKTADEPRVLDVPKGLKPRTELGIMTVKSIRSTPVHIRAEVLKWVYSLGSEKKRIIPVMVKAVPKPSFGGLFSSIFSGLSSSPATPQRGPTPLPQPDTPEVDPQGDLLTANDSAVSLTVYSAEVTTKLDRKFSAALHRSTKKEPPSKLRYELIYTGKREYDASVLEDSKYPSSTGSIFQGLRSDLEGLGTTRVFIGHSTAQTTGIGGHMASRFIPTVERESIDFMDRNIAVWNKELLYVGGILARSAYEFELQDIKTTWGTLKADAIENSSQERQALIQRSIHAMKFFTFHTSTPSADVSQLLETAFFACSTTSNFPIVSSRGVMNCSEIRMPDASLSTFVKDLPVVPQEVISDAPQMLGALQSKGHIKSITFDDVLKELNSRPLSTSEMVSCLQWWAQISTDYRGDRNKLATVQRTLIDAAIITTETPGKAEKLTLLSTIKTFVNPKSIIPVDGPLPAHVLPLDVSKELDTKVLWPIFGWYELPVVEWLTYVCSVGDKEGAQFDIEVSPPWAERVLSVLSRGWPSLTGQDKETIVASLKDKTCIPTSGGMKSPEQAYFASVNIFQDLPIVTLPSGNSVRGAMDRLLQALGVRKHVELQVLFNRMIKTNQWTVADLVKYLASIRSTLSNEEFTRLKSTAAFSKETGSDAEKAVAARYQARQLYEPLDVFRKLHLPVLDWGQNVRWRGSSEEAKFLFDLGLQRQPPLGTIISLCTDEDSETRSVALRYLLDNVTTKYPDYDAHDFISLAYIPALRDSQPCLATPKEVVSNIQWAELGFLILDPAYQKDASKLQVEAHPPPAQLIQLLKTKPPKDIAQATKWFNIISPRLPEFSSSQLQTLSQTAFVPTKIGHLVPSSCYIGAQSNNSIHAALFTFVNFGGFANSFLMACGAKQEPTIEEIAKIILESPSRYFKLCGEDAERYLQELRNLAINLKVISGTTIMRMKRSPILLAIQFKPKLNAKGEDPDDEEMDATYGLKKADEIVVVDETNTYQAFKDVLWIAPQEDLIESLYQTLGSRKLSMHVKEEYQCTSEVLNSKKAVEIQELVLERLPLLLYEHTHSRTRVSMGWLSTPGNLVVKTYGKIAVARQLKVGELRISKSQEVSAIAKRLAGGPIQLWIAGNTQIDMYDVAMSLNKQLFDVPKANDALLLMTFLSTDLRSLKRRGYNVNRILKQRAAALPPPAAPPVLPQDHSIAKPPIPGVPSAPLGGGPPPPLPPKPDSGLQQALTQAHANQQHGSSPLGNWINKAKDSLQNVRSNAPTRSSSPAPVSIGGTEARPMPPSAPSTSKPSTATPTNVIAHNIDLAVKACKEESGNVLHNRESMQEVHETRNESYCDVSGTSENLRLAGEMGKVKIYLSDDVPPEVAYTFLRDNQDALARFIHILLPLSRVYDLPQSTLHIFYDVTGGLIAFNRNASLFVNFRFYQSWHDAEVQTKQLNNAYISWYFTLAHEIAHNLVQPHNSEHEFYFSAICEKYLMSLGRLLAAN
ncbi:hypothetical protein D9611_000170 [Ephemerocybe angulata]|uniref:Sacsin/Nov domain-containing protein n=1 Tax=Ephemerocybe angulata TaxID=980116 RepID=A0A8H5BMZ7_9AGAR|nr:hypothetical protein D9611_000170 [Tulosesus angulatus]